MGKSHSTEYRQDPNQVKQFEMQIAMIKDNAARERELMRVMNKQKDDMFLKLQEAITNGGGSSEEAKKMQATVDDLAAQLKKKTEEEEQRRQALKDLRDYPPAHFQTTEDFKNGVHIAIVGETRTGKSTLNNTLRGIGPKDPGACKVLTGRECVMKEPVGYKHKSKILNGQTVTIWDIPGHGTDNYPGKTYMKRFGLRYFNVVIVVTTDTIKTMDGVLMTEIQKFQIPHVVLRNKISTQLENAEQDGDDPVEVLKSIRRDFAEKGYESKDVFLIDARFGCQEKWDFQRLIVRLQEIVASQAGVRSIAWKRKRSDDGTTKKAKAIE